MISHFLKEQSRHICISQSWSTSQVFPFPSAKVNCPHFFIWRQSIYVKRQIIIPSSTYPFSLIRFKLLKGWEKVFAILSKPNLLLKYLLNKSKTERYWIKPPTANLTSWPEVPLGSLWIFCVLSKGRSSILLISSSLTLLLEEIGPRSLGLFSPHMQKPNSSARRIYVGKKIQILCLAGSS